MVFPEATSLPGAVHGVGLDASMWSLVAADLNQSREYAAAYEVFAMGTLPSTSAG